MSDDNISLLRELFDEKLKTFDDKIKGVTLQNNAEFTVLNARMTMQDVTLARIEGQTLKTNGRVNILEGKLSEVQLDESNHILNCPQADAIEKLSTKLDEKKADTEKKLNDINIDLREYRFFKKYPKIAIGILAVGVFGIFISSYLTVTKLNMQSANIKANSVIGISSNTMLKANTLELLRTKENSPIIDSLIKGDIEVLDSLKHIK